MSRQTAIVEIEGQNILVAYRKTVNGIALSKTSIAETGQPMWLNLNQQKKAKEQIA